MYPVEKAGKACLEILLNIGVRPDVAREVTDCLIETSLRGIDSHGINLLPHYVSAVLAGRINPNPEFKFKKTSDTTGLLDADDSFGHAAGSSAIKEAIQMGKVSGSGFVNICNSTHFSACAYYSLQAAREGMIGISATHTGSMMLSSRGRRPYLGTNPISFTFPCEGEEPVCLDMATTQITWNSVKLAAQKKRKLGYGLAVDKDANVVEDPQEAAALLPMGSYKGYGLGFVVEVLCSLLAGAAYGPHIVKMYQASVSQKRKLAHFVGAINIEKFVEIGIFKKMMKSLITELRNEPAVDPDLPVLAPGDPEKKAQESRRKNGIPLTGQTVEKINALIRECNISEELFL